MAQSVRKFATGAGVALFILSILSIPLSASSAETPRRVAIAPFANLTGQDEIKPVVSVLPRLLSTRLMALSGAETVLLPPEKSSAEAAKEAGFPFLLQGTVSKLGKGYSIDTTVTDVATGKSAGAFFTAAATEDDIIPQLGVLAADMAEKLFGVRVARPQPAPAPAPAVAAPVPSAVVPAPAAASAQAAGAIAPQAPAPGTPAAVSGVAPGAAGGWTPASIKKISQSDKIADELFGVVAGDTNEAGDGEIVAYGARTLYIYRVKGNEILPYTRIPRPLSHHFLNVEAFDLDGDGKKEILVTDLIGEKVQSFVLKRKGDVYEVAADSIPYYLVVLPDWMGKPAVIGQSAGIDSPFQGRFALLKWGGKGFATGENLPQDTNLLPLANGVIGTSSARFGKEWKLLYTDDASRLRVVDDSGKSEYKSRNAYGMGVDIFEWGPVVLIEGKRKQYVLRKAPRPAAETADGPLVLLPEVKRGLLNVTTGSYESTRLVLLQWDGGEFAEKAGSPYVGAFLTGVDATSSSGLRKGGRVVATSIEQFESLMKNKVSRLVLFQVE